MADQLQLRALSYQLGNLDDELLGAEEKQAALQALEAAGLTAAPLLVVRLAGPDAFFLDDRVIETGPLNPGPPLRAATSVHFELEALLYRLVTPPDAIREEPGLGPGAPPVTEVPPPFVEDWQRWWAAHQGEDLPAIHAWARREIAAMGPGLGAGGALGARAPGPPPPPARLPRPSETERAAYAEAKRVLAETRAGRMTLEDGLRRLEAQGQHSSRVLRHATYFSALLRGR